MLRLPPPALCPLVARGRVFVRDGPAAHDLCTYRLEEPGHYAGPGRTGVFLRRRLRPSLHANALVPAVTRHRRIERRGGHTHTGSAAQAIVNLPEERLHLLRLVIAEHWIDPGD